MSPRILAARLALTSALFGLLGGALLGGALLGVSHAQAQPQTQAQAQAQASTTSAAPARAAKPVAPSPADPFESFNRGVFLFNGIIDHFLIKPVAEVYESAIPRPVRLGVGNVIGNISDAWSVLNLVLQGKPARAAEMTMRVSINTVLGLGGVLDIATEAGLERQSEDLGQTLASWGVPAGPYLVLPLLGPSTLRDAVVLPIDRAAISEAGPQEAPNRWRWLGLQLTSARTDALPFTRMLDTIALDKYTFVRDAHLARRRSLIHDGNPPSSDDEEPAAGSSVPTSTKASDQTPP